MAEERHQWTTESRVDELLASIEAKRAEAAELHQRLKRSLALQRMLPKKSVAWPVKSHWQGSPSKGFMLHVTEANGTGHKFTPEDVPEELRDTAPPWVYASAKQRHALRMRGR
jgi:hypothetical protein